MWKGLVRAPQGRISLRKFTMLFATLLVACFAYSLTFVTPAAALDATWTDDNRLTYDNQTYKGPTQTPQNDSSGLELGDDVDYYTYVPDSSRKPYDVWVIYFAPSTTPTEEDTATRAKYSYDGSKYSSKSDVTAITITAANSSGSTSTASGDASSCVIEGIGWIICPVTTFLAKGMDLIYSLVDGFLEVRPLATSTDQPMYRVWSYFLNIANILFIIGILIMVYAQVTGAVLSNYTIKKLLPRVIISAVFVNLSYWICAIAIDLSNILGYSIQDMFIGMRNGIVGGEGNSWDVISWESFAALILSGGSLVGGAGIAAYLGISSGALAVAGGGIVSGLIFLLLPMLISVLFVILMTFLILAARQAIITILVILAPLAVAAYLLPNTEEWFKRWRKTFMTLLLVFPGFSVIFGGSQLAAAIIIQNATSINVILLGMAVQVVPLAITPLLLRLGGGVLNRFAGIVNNPTKGIFDRGKTWARDRSGQHRTAGLAALDARAKTRGFNDGKPVRSNRTTRRGRFIENTGNKLNPYNVAYKREYDRRNREGMKSANEAMSEGLFVQTAAGQRIYNRNQDAGLEKHAGENANFRAYKTAMNTGGDAQNTYRRHLHHQAHIDKGVGDIHEERMTNHAELDLQNQVVRNVGGIGDIKIQAKVDSGLAENAKKEVDARGALRLEETILASNALRTQSKMIHEYEGRAAQARALIEDEGKSHWEELSLNDRTIYSRQLERQGNAKKLEELQKQWNSILAEAASGKTNDYNRKFGPITSQVAASIDAIGSADEAIAVEEFRKARADYIGKLELNKRLKADPRLLERASGIDPEGGVKVLAELQKEGSALHMQNVEAAKSVFTNDKNYTNDKLELVYRNGLLADGRTKATLTQRHAAIQRLMTETGNNYAVQDVLDFSNEIGVVEAGVDAQGNTIFQDIYGNTLSDDEVDNRRDMQQIINDASKKASKVDWYSGTDRGMAESGRYVARDRNGSIRTDFAGSELSIAGEINKGKVDRDRAYSADIDVIDKQARVLADPRVARELLDPLAASQYADALEEFLKDPLTGMKLEKRKRGSYHILLKELRAITTNTPIDLQAMDTSYNDVATGDTVAVLEGNRIHRKPLSKSPSGPVDLS